MNIWVGLLIIIIKTKAWTLSKFPHKTCRVISVPGQLTNNDLSAQQWQRDLHANNQLEKRVWWPCSPHFVWHKSSTSREKLARIRDNGGAQKDGQTRKTVRLRSRRENMFLSDCFYLLTTKMNALFWFTYIFYSMRLLNASLL